MEQTLSRLRGAAAELRPLLRFSPRTGRLWIDLVLLLLVGALQFSVVPSLTRALFPVDLMTPWVVTALVFETLPRGALKALVAAMILETHSTAPKGLYVCAYWVVAVVLYLTRGTLSWRHAFPWLVTFVLSQLWVIGFETFVIAVGAGTGQVALEPAYLLGQSARLGVSVALGLALARRFMRTGLSEEGA